MKTFSLSEYSELIEKLLNFLKEHKVSQNIVSDRINYYSLSKVKNFKKYPQKIIEGKNRAEVFKRILDEYSIFYDLENDDFKVENEDLDLTSKPLEITHYVIYYFSLAKQIVGKGLVSIKEKKWATIDFIDPNHTQSQWKGTFDVVEGYTFLTLEKRGDTTPIKALYSLFSGTIKHGRPILIGTYSSIKRDGSPTAGNVVFEKVNTKEIGIEKINTRTNSKISAFLFNKNFTLKSITPSTVEDLPKLLLSDLFFGDYKLYWPYKNNDLLVGSMTIKETGDVLVEIESQLYNGPIQYHNSNTLLINLKNNQMDPNFINNDIIAYLNVNNYSRKNGVIGGIILTPNLLSLPSSFPILLIEKSKKISIKVIGDYFNRFNSPLITAKEPLDLVAIFN